MQQHLEVFNLGGLNNQYLLCTQGIAYRVLWGDLEEDLIEQIIHDRIALDCLFEFLNCGLVPFESSLMLGSEVNVLFEEAIVDFGIRWKPASVSPELGGVVRHCEKTKKGWLREIVVTNCRESMMRKKNSLSYIVYQMLNAE